MKKSLLTLALGIFAFAAQLQAQNFFETVTFTGALSTNTVDNWTAGWTNWDPQNTVYPTVTDTVTLDAYTNPNGYASAGVRILEISNNLKLDSTKTYRLRGFVVVLSGAKLTVPAGTIVRAFGDKAVLNYATLIIRPGAQIFATGTKDKPVIFTSNNAPGNRAIKALVTAGGLNTPKVIGDWGGLVIFGNARNNGPGGSLTQEGFAEAKVSQFGVHGGTNDNDNSGVLKYVRVEFAGFDFDVNKELNGFTFGSVGRGTTVDYLQSSYGGDDAYEWFGGCVNAKHLVALGTADDDFDMDNGFSGGLQFGIGVKDSTRFDASYNITGGSTSEGFEVDNDADGSTRTPITKAVVSNFTMLGPIHSGFNFSTVSNTVKSAFRRGARLRRNSAISIFNTIFVGYNRSVVFVEGSLSLANYGVSGTTQAFDKDGQFKNNIVWKSDASNALYSGLVETAVNTDLPLLNSWVKNSSNSIKFDSSLTYRNDFFVNPNVGPNIDVTPKSAASIAGASFTSTRYNSVAIAGIVSNEGEFVGTTAYAYPNPTEDVSYLTFGSSVSTPASVSVFDLSGVQVNKFDTFINAGSNNILVDGLEAGTYIVKLSTPKGSVMTFKVLKF